MALLLTACGDDSTPFDTVPEEDAGDVTPKDDVGGPTFPDLGVPADRGFPTDQGTAPRDVPAADAGFDAGAVKPDAGGDLDAGSAPDAGARDTGVRDTGPADTGPAPDPCAGASVIDLNAMGTLAGETTTYAGTNASAPAGAPLRPLCGLGASGHQVVLRYTPRASARLRVSTDNAGTASGFDTLVWAQASCASLPVGNAGLGCNDDQTGGTRALTSTFVTAAAVTAATPVYIVVAGYNATATGAFELTVTEVVPLAAGAACDPRTSATLTCATGLTCIATGTSTTMGTCVADGAAGGRCRATGDACDAGLACNGAATAVASRCRAAVAVGGACDPARVASLCVTGASCVSANGASTCVADGARGGTCRVVAPRCDGALTCSTNTGAGVCREVVVLGGACDPAAVTSVCPTASICAAGYGATVGACVADGSQGGRCRTSGAACAAGLLCTGAASATTSRCLPSVAVGGACDPVGEANVCAVGTGCIPSPVGWTCVADGDRGGFCRTSGARCDTGLTCITGTVDDYCRERLAAGAACDASNVTTICATNQSCVATAGQTAGACAANGTAAGADCRTTGTRCDAGLACSTTSGAGWCQRAAMASMACDFSGRVTLCPTMTACAPSSATAGVCAAAVAETEPNNSVTSPAPTVTASTVFSGSVEAAGRDCVGVQVPAGGAIFAEAQLPAAPTCPAGGADPFITVFNPSGALIAYEDDSPGRTRCSLLDPTLRPELARLAAGRYVVCINGYNNTAVPNYLFTVGVVR